MKNIIWIGWTEITAKVEYVQSRNSSLLDRQIVSKPVIKLAKYSEDLTKKKDAESYVRESLEDGDTRDLKVVVAPTKDLAELAFNLK